MNVIFIEPCFPNNQREFARALHAAGANVIGIGERPVEYLPDDVKSWLLEYVQVSSVVHEPSLLDAVKSIQSKIWVDRLEATVEAHIMAAAAVREATGIPGTSTKTAYLCRDKPAMKEALRKAGIACAQSMRAKSAGDARAFAASVGYPLIIKPPAGAGAAGTYRVRDDEEQARADRAGDHGEQHERQVPSRVVPGGELLHGVARLGQGQGRQRHARHPKQDVSEQQRAEPRAVLDAAA